MVQEFKEFAEKIEEEVIRSRKAWFARDKTNTIKDFVLILQAQVGQLSEGLLKKRSWNPKIEAIHTAAVSYEIYKRVKERGWKSCTYKKSGSRTDTQIWKRKNNSPWGKIGSKLP